MYTAGLHSISAQPATNPLANKNAQVSQSNDSEQHVPSQPIAISELVSAVEKSNNISPEPPYALEAPTVSDVFQTTALDATVSVAVPNCPADLKKPSTLLKGEMLLLAVIVCAAMLCTTGATSGIAVDDACSTNAFCNYEGDSPMDHTKCDSSVCVCTSLYYGEAGDTTCVQASLGGSCAGKTDAAAFCATSDPDAECASDVCACSAGFYETESLLDGTTHCSKVAVGTPCDSSAGGDAFCRTGLPADSECIVITQTCECPSGKTYVPSLDLCHTESFHATCATCRQTGGHCYDIEDDDSPTGCVCPPSKDSSGVALTVGCDLGIALIGDYCDPTGTPAVDCELEDSSCLHAGALNGRFTCQCDPGYHAISLFGDERKCYRSIAKETDRNCMWCQSRGGICYDIDDDGVRDGCMCPATRSTSDPNDPSTDCDVNHVTVSCTASRMDICYTPHDTTRLPGMATKLTNGDAYVYIERHLGEDPCRFEYDGSSDWCVSLDLASDQTDACDTRVTFPTNRHISYNNWMVLQTTAIGRSMSDESVHLYCQYDIISHVFTETGTEVVGFASMASEGDEVHPVLTMDVHDEFGRDATVQGIRQGQPTMLIIEMTEDKSVYHSIRPEVCIASNRPELSNPATSSILLLYEGCPVVDSYLNAKNTFYPDPADAEVSRTGYFPMLQFEDTQFVFFHCAVEVCRNDEDCDPVDCSGGVERRKRAIASLEGDTILQREVRELQSGSTRLEALYTGPVQIIADSNSRGSLSVRTDKSDSALPRKYLLLISIGGGAMILVIAVAAAILVTMRSRRRRAPRNAVSVQCQETM
ncbi:uncharacterized protein LOC135492957 [Lineus longissimus]|uniref:uncharacterized protein LOC135492957 n=1 Tax=Lineus longissimus TaxID=88925 RepID=UPI00315D7356